MNAVTRHRIVSYSLHSAFFLPDSITFFREFHTKKIYQNILFPAAARTNSTFSTKKTPVPQESVNHSTNQPTILKNGCFFKPARMPDRPAKILYTFPQMKVHRSYVPGITRLKRGARPQPWNPSPR
jgi:hypothetical protein